MLTITSGGYYKCLCQVFSFSFLSVYMKLWIFNFAQIRQQHRCHFADLAEMDTGASQGTAGFIVLNFGCQKRFHLHVHECRD